MKLKIIGLLLLSLLGGVFIGSELEKKKVEPAEKIVPDNPELRAGKGRFTNPILECKEREDIEYDSLLPLKKELQDLLAEQKKSNNITEASIYYRDLNSGPWIGINEKQVFVPASLLKIPIMVTILKLSEQNPNILDEKIIYDGEFDGEANLENLEQKLEQGKEYSIKEMIEKMIIYSDNLSKMELMKYIALQVPADTLTQLIEEITVFWPDSKLNIKEVSTKNYASFFRILYNASYLSLRNSEYALDLLAQSINPQGLKKDLPPDIKIARKYGINVPDANEAETHYHDCGIIYKPASPYILCIMTKGKNINDLNNFVGNVSKIIYEYE